MVAYKFYDERENTAMTMTEQQAKLFTKLRTLDPSVIEDGLPNETEYLSATTHIMYVLKEVNGGSGWSLCEHLRHGGRQQEHDATWDNIARWTQGIFSLPKELSWEQLEYGCKSRREQMLPKICAVNVKKTSGSYVSNGKEVYTEALNNAAILKQQLDFYQPDLVICCGTEHAFVDACFPGESIEWKMTTRGIGYFVHDKRLVISFLHPAARVKDCYLYYALLDAVREILHLSVR